MSTASQVCGRSSFCSCLCLFALRKERMQLIHSLQMDRFYGSDDSTSIVSGCICYTCLWGGTWMANRRDLNIKLSQLRSQCKSAHCDSQSGRADSGSCVRLWCLRAGCPWQQRQAHVSLDLPCSWHMVLDLLNLWVALL